jgi:DNA polymerase-3 subunit epsilon
MARLADEERFEEAALWRERLGHLGSASLRTHRLSMLAAEPELVAARPSADHGWDIHLMRFGRLAGAAHAAPGLDPRPVVEALIASGEHVGRAIAPAPAGLTEEAMELLAWLDTDGVRLVRSSGGLALPRCCGGDLVVRLGEVRRSTHVAWHDTHDRQAVARTSRPSGPVDAVAVTRMLSA